MIAEAGRLEGDRMVEPSSGSKRTLRCLYKLEIFSNSDSSRESELFRDLDGTFRRGGRNPLAIRTEPFVEAVRTFSMSRPALSDEPAEPFDESDRTF